jgi:hypothetical protein
MADSPSPETLRFMERQLTINKELGESISEVKELVIQIKTTTENIHEQTRLTNGRVNRHDDFINKYGDSIKETYETNKQERQRIKNLIWKIVAVASVVTLFGINAEQVISLIL